MNQFIEFSHWGWNSITAGFLGTIVFGLLQAGGLLKQLRKIRRKQSGESIPILMYAFNAVQFVTFGIYGYRQDSLAMTLNAVLSLLYIRVYFLATRYPDSKPRNWWHILFAILIPWMLITSHPQTLMGAVLTLACISLIQSPWEIWKNRTVGSVDLGFLLVFSGSMAFWLMYAVCIGDWMLVSVNIFGSLIMAATLYLYFRFQSTRYQH